MQGEPRMLDSRVRQKTTNTKHHAAAMPGACASAPASELKGLDCTSCPPSKHHARSLHRLLLTQKVWCHVGFHMSAWPGPASQLSLIHKFSSQLSWLSIKPPHRTAPSRLDLILLIGTNLRYWKNESGSNTHSFLISSNPFI